MRINHIVVSRNMASFLIFALTLVNIVIYYHQPQSQIVLFDENIIKSRLIRQLAEHKASLLQVNIATKKFNAALNLVLKKYALNHRVIILNKNMTLAGGKDITTQIAKDVSLAMRSK